MPAIDYSQYTAQATAAGRKHGLANAELLKQKKEYERKLRMEQRFAQLAKDKQMHENELAKTEYVEAAKAQGLEAKDFQQAYEAGWITEDDQYTRKYFEDKAKEERRKLGIKFTSEEEQTWLNSENGLKAEADRLQSGHAKYKSRQYKTLDAERYYRQQLAYNAAQAQRTMDSPVYSSGAEGAAEKFGDRLGDFLSDNLFGKEEPMQRPVKEEGPAPRTETFDEIDVSGPVDLGVRRMPTEKAKPIMIDNARDYEGNPMPNVVFYPEGRPGVDEGAVHVQLQVMEDGSIEQVPVNVTTISPEKAQGERREFALKDVQDNQIDIDMQNKLSESRKVLKVGNRLKHALTADTGSSIKKLVSWASTFAETELVATFGSDKEKLQYMEEVGDNTLKAWEIAAGEKDVAPSEMTMKALRSAFAGMDQDTRTLAYALVKLNRAGGRFNGQELKEQLQLLADGSPAERRSVLKRAMETAQESAEQTSIDIATRDFQKVGYAQHGVSVTTAQLKGHIEDVEYFDDGTMMITYRDDSPLKATMMFPNGGINHHLRRD